MDDPLTVTEGELSPDEFIQALSDGRRVVVRTEMRTCIENQGYARDG